MILYLLILGVVEAQIANVTEEELSQVLGNQTFINNSTHNAAMTSVNVTSSLYEDDKNKIEDLLRQNRTVVTEDDENFQEQENLLRPGRCLQEELINFSHQYCGATFDAEMSSIGVESWCVMENITRAYNNLTECLELVTNYLGCFYPNPDIEEFYLDVHSYYFHNCSNEEIMHDAPQWLVVLLTLIPVSIIPILVYLVVWKSKVQD